jgi:hypothetical protein
MSLCALLLVRYGWRNHSFEVFCFAVLSSSYLAGKPHYLFRGVFAEYVVERVAIDFRELRRT